MSSEVAVEVALNSAEESDHVSLGQLDNDELRKRLQKQTELAEMLGEALARRAE